MKLGDYELLHALKSGGMGDVLLARRRGPAGFEQLVAIKTVRADLATAPLAKAMFLDEARLLARLTHPGIAQILDFGEVDGVAYMVMEYVPGMSFRGLADLRPPPAVLCQAVAEACRGLHAAHELRDLVDGHLLGVVHRDISPDNLMVGYDARVKVLDFGIALVRGRQAPVTELGVLKGKPPYMSPEQIKNLPIDRRADVFSTSVVLWELVTGRPLFEGDSIYAVARAVEHQEIVPPSRIAGPLPDELDELILAGLERDPDRRLSSAAAMAEVLERIAGAGGHESLESWADRALAVAREAHRGWLAGVLGGRRDPQPVGRATGMRTALDATTATPAQLAETARTTPADAARGGYAETAVQLAETVPGAPLAETARGDAPITDVEPATTTPRRRWIALVLLLIAVGGGGLWLALRPRGGAAVAPIDAAAIDAGVIDAAIAVPIDAGPIDAREPDRRRDAGTVRAVDAGRRAPADAAPPPIDAAPRPVDAAPRPIDAAPAGFGTLRVRVMGTPRPGEREAHSAVYVDGVYIDDTPVTGARIAAGRRRIEVKDPSTNQVLLDSWIDVAPGQIVLLP